MHPTNLSRKERQPTPQHFFQSVYREPYKHIIVTEGAAVGSYRPNDGFLKPRQMDVTADKFAG